MALDQMAAETLPPAQRALQIDPVSGLPETQRGKLPGLGHDVEAKLAVPAGGRKRRQAAAVHGHGVPAAHPTGQAPCPDGKAVPTADGLQGDDAALTFDQTGEHGRKYTGDRIS